MSVGVTAALSTKIPCPAQASAVGFTKLAFHDEFRDFYLVDTKNTQAGGFKWYVNTVTPNFAGVDPAQTHSQLGNLNPSATASDLSIVNGTVLNIGFISGGGNPGILCSAVAGATGGYTGNVFGPGGYLECRFKALVTTPGYGDYAFFGIPINSWINATAAARDYLEIDPMESRDSTHINAGVYQQDLTYYPQDSLSSLGGPLCTPTVDWTQWNTFGVLWQTKAQHGGGTGKLKYYMNDVLINDVEADLTYSVSGNPANNGVPGTCKDNSDQEPYIFFLKGAQSQWDFVRVWGP